MAENVKKKENGFVRFFKRVAKFFRDCKGEIVTLFVFLLDTVFMNLLGLVMDVAG